MVQTDRAGLHGQTKNDDVTTRELSEASNIQSSNSSSVIVEVEEPHHPYRWLRWKKGCMVALVAYCECLTFLVSMLLAPSVPQVLETFRPDGSGKALGSFCVTVYILGFVIGPLTLAPLSDLYGRLVLYRVYIILYICFTIGCALAPSLEALIVFRFLAGCMGGAPMAMGRAVVADLYPPGDRVTPMASYSFGVIMAPTIGPILGGVATGKMGWRWVFWIATILAVFAALGIFFVLQETHLPTIRRKELNKNTERRRFDLHNTWADMPSPALLATTLRDAVKLPVQIAAHMSCLIPLIMICIFNGTTNMILSSLGSVFQSEYEFPATTSGLSYLGIGIGGMAGLSTAKTLMRLVTKIFPIEDEGRKHANLLPFISTTCLIPLIGLLWYGWSVETKTFWIVPIIGLFFFGFGYMCMQLSILLFVVESVPNYSGSAGGAFTIASSIGGAVVPLSTFALYDSIGFGWGNTVIAGVDILVAVVAAAMYFSARMLGDRWRLTVIL